MVEHKIIITTSGIGSRLGSLTEYTNKSLVRIGDKPALSHILDSYGKNSKFIITIGHHGDKVKQYVSIAHKNWDIEFVQVDNYQGPGSSLGYSISLCENSINCPFIFHACDTIIKSNIPIDFTNNWVVGSKSADTSHYRTIRFEGNKVLGIKEKGEIDVEFCYVGIAGIKDYYEFFENLKLELVKKQETSDADVINSMLLNNNFELREIIKKDWLDIGNVTSLNSTKNQIKPTVDILEKKDEDIFFHEDLVIKFFNDSNVNLNRVKRNEKLGDVVPKVIDYSNNFYAYKKVEGNLFSKTANPESFEKFLYWSKDNLWKKIDVSFDKFSDLCKKFYIDKTLARANLYLENCQDEESIINGRKVPGIIDLINRINFDWISKGVPVQFHGDFILDNVIEKENEFILLDWRQDFQGNLEVGDIYYDIAKLNHNLTINHEIINMKMFQITDISEGEKNCDILCYNRLMECKNVLFEFVKRIGLDEEKIKMLSSIIWINMAGLHERPFSKFLFNFGKYHLARSLKI